MSGAPAGSHAVHVDADGADVQLLAISMTKGLDEETTKDLVVKATGGQSESVMDMLLERARFQPHQVTEPYRLMVDLCNHVSSIIHSPNCLENSDVLDRLRQILTGVCAEGTRHAAVVPCCLELAAKCLIVMEYWSNDYDMTSTLPRFIGRLKSCSSTTTDNPALTKRMAARRCFDSLPNRKCVPCTSSGPAAGRPLISPQFSSRGAAVFTIRMKCSSL